jgi:uncharacterized protein (DUF427 family)
MNLFIKREKPGPGQESVWDYPRPPRLEWSSRKIRVFFNGIKLADSSKSARVLETSHPPVYYIPPEDIVMEYLRLTSYHTYCEWKGSATYYTVEVNGIREVNTAWSYLKPSENFETISGYIAFYPSRMEACYVDDELVRAQEGDFYGGWITNEIVGPFKGVPDSFGW